MRIVALITFLTVIIYVESKNIIDVFAGYVENERAGKLYKVMYKSRDWKRAVETCRREGAKLAVPKTQQEFHFLQNLVRDMYYPRISGTSYKLLVWLGINNLDDFRIWRNIEGENIELTGFHQWAGDNGNGFSDNPEEPHCVGMDASNMGLRDWWCHRAQPFVCEKPVVNNYRR